MKLYLAFEHDNKKNYVKNVIGIFSTFEKAQNAIKTVTTSYKTRDRCMVEVRFLDYIIDDTLLGGKSLARGLLDNPQRKLEWGKRWYKKTGNPKGPKPKEWSL